jgi:hypothetical protein
MKSTQSIVVCGGTRLAKHPPALHEIPETAGTTRGKPEKYRYFDNGVRASDRKKRNEAIFHGAVLILILGLLILDFLLRVIEWAGSPGSARSRRVTVRSGCDRHRKVPQPLVAGKYQRVAPARGYTGIRSVSCHDGQRDSGGDCRGIGKLLSEFRAWRIVSIETGLLESLHFYS